MIMLSFLWISDEYIFVRAKDSATVKTLAIIWIKEWNLHPVHVCKKARPSNKLFVPSCLHVVLRTTLFTKVYIIRTYIHT